VTSSWFFFPRLSVRILGFTTQEQRLPLKSKNVPLVVFIYSPSSSQKFCSDLLCAYWTFQRKIMPVSVKAKVPSQMSLHFC